jgi:hypothetical protein
VLYENNMLLSLADYQSSWAQKRIKRDDDPETISSLRESPVKTNSIGASSLID